MAISISVCPGPTDPRTGRGTILPTRVSSVPSRPNWPSVATVWRGSGWPPVPLSCRAEKRVPGTREWCLPAPQGGQLYFYYLAWDGHHGLQGRKAAGGLAVLTRDRYLAVTPDAVTPDRSAASGRLTTAVLQASRGRLWVNAAAGQSQITVRLVSAEGDPLPGYETRECTPITGDSLAHVVCWGERDQLPEDVYFKIEFILSERAQLYGFGARQ